MTSLGAGLRELYAGPGNLLGSLQDRTGRRPDGDLWARQELPGPGRLPPADLYAAS
ncbi:hypothetical protein [Nonomuraea pusilla]|uniref:hypothetical protein n=1 Tax=Nonomuraea pusilla TaxID=46177 RepID=UPI0015A6774E|nr:hypothetical protein [Nonomuraea pusilla]